HFLVYFAISLLSFVMVLLSEFVSFIPFSMLHLPYGAQVLGVFVPVIFLTVVFQFTYPLHAFERTSVGSSIGRAFKLAKGRWWVTFALFFTLIVLTVILNGAVDLPALFISGFASLSGINGFEDPDGAATRYMVFMTLVSLITSATAVLMMPFIQVPMSLHMLSTVEKKEAPGLLDEVRQYNMDLPA
ncbi:MAG TPA: hypothetical protein VHL57_08145, partial [Flavobacteriales bacterium]|nr:hypothetical protein [Flavobacteriales bacterium]